MGTLREGGTCRSDDLREDTRWPRFAAHAVSDGVLSLMSFPLCVRSDGRGALDVYGDTAGAFDADAEHIGVLLRPTLQSLSRPAAPSRTCIQPWTVAT